jgi:hypothetical protein
VRGKEAGAPVQLLRTRRDFRRNMRFRAWNMTAIALNLARDLLRYAA